MRRSRLPYLALLCCFCLAGEATPATREPLAFPVRVTLSPQAAATLATRKEGIIVDAAYAGDALPARKRYADHIGQIYLGSERVEVPGHAATVAITGTKVRRARLGWIDGPVLLNVNVYSARHSGPDNLLDCDFFDGELASAVAHPMTLHCSLITERAATAHKS